MVGLNSRRLRSNQKSAIFDQAFDASFAQSPGRKHFDISGETSTQPIDLHIDLGNYCNLSCKMCSPKASSRIAVHLMKKGHSYANQFLANDWTKDDQVWNNFKGQLLSINKLNNIHFMGGETLLTDRFEDLVDTMTAAQRFDVCFSFVSNGTVWNPSLIGKLKKFRRVGLEISIESVTQHNSYIRQGTDTDQVLTNIQRYRDLCNDSSVTLTLRPAISALSIGYYHSLLQFALDNKLVVKSLLVNQPRFLAVDVLPDQIKQAYKEPYWAILNQVLDADYNTAKNASDPNNYRALIKNQAKTCLELLDTPTATDHRSLQEQLVQHCKFWDEIYKQDADQFYPEFKNLLSQYAY